ncbi:hypothetical protein D8S82_02635, partial [Mycobacterium hodleri]
MADRDFAAPFELPGETRRDEDAPAQLSLDAAGVFVEPGAHRAAPSAQALEVEPEPPPVPEP